MARAAKKDKEFEDAQQRILRWRREGPARFAVDALGMPEKWDDVRKEGVMPWWWEASEKLVARRRLSIRSGHGVGKAQPKSLMLHTPAGLVRWGDLRVGDSVFGVDGRPTKIGAIHEQGIKPVYRVTLDDGSSTLCCGDHVWTVRGRAQRRGGGEWIDRTTAELVAAGLHRKNGIATTRNWQLPASGAVEFQPQDVPVEPYLLGLWLGDGGRNSGRITNIEPDVVEQLNERGHLHSTGDKSGTDAKAIGVYGLKAKLRGLGVLDKYAQEKSVPKCYILNSADVRAEILRGLLDTDGEVGKDNHSVGFSSTSKLLADDVVWLARSLGGKARIAKAVKQSFYRDANGEKVHCLPCYRVSLTFPAGFIAFYVKRKQARIKANEERYLHRWIDSIETEGEDECMCITVENEDGLYLTNDFIVTHNSAFLAITLIWFQTCYFPTKIPCTAPTAHQLSDVLWAEIAKWLRVLEGTMPGLAEQFEWTRDEFRLKAAPAESFAVARTARADKPEALQGFHSENLLIIADEASGIPDIVFEVGQGAMSSEGAFAIFAANPTRRSGMFYETHHSLREKWATMVVNGEECPMVSQQFCDEMAFQYGKDSNVYRVRVLGEFPTADDDTVIPIDLCEAAKIREVDAYGDTIWGVDVARFGRDRTVLVKRCTNATTEAHKSWSGNDTMQTSGRIYAEWLETAPDKRPKTIFVDAIGIGAGVVDRLMELGMPVTGVNVAEEASVSDLYLRLRDELWFKARKWLEKKDCKLAEDETLIAELSLPKYAFTSSGKLKVESKDEMKKRYPQSPDVADAFCMTFAHAIENRARGYYEPECFPDS